MTTAPKCKVCGEAHFGPAHVWKGERAKPGAITPIGARERVVAAPVADPRDAQITDLTARVAELEHDAAQAKARREAQRLLMQQRRAIARAPGSMLKGGKK